MSVSMFERQIGYLRERYNVISLKSLVEKLSAGPLEKSYVAVTVDDGYQDFAEYAYPVLQKYEVPATVYLVSGFVDGQFWLWFDALHFIASNAETGEYELSVKDQLLRGRIDGAETRHALWETVADMSVNLDPVSRTDVIDAFGRQMGVVLPSTPPPEYAAMSWETIRSLDRNLIEWGGHTISHPILSLCSLEEQIREIREGRLRVQEMTQQPVESFCYPNGQCRDYTRQTIEAVQSAGFTSAVVSHGGMVDFECDPYVIGRLGAPDNEMDFKKCTDGIWEVRRRMRKNLAALFAHSTSAESATVEDKHRY